VHTPSPLPERGRVTIGVSLQSVGFASPDDVSTQAAIEANDVFIARLEAIRDRAQGDIH